MSLAGVVSEGMRRAQMRSRGPVGISADEPKPSVFDSLVEYIPTETVTIYVGLLGIAAMTSAPRWMNAWMMYKAGILLTIVFVVLSYMLKLKAAKLPLSLKTLPVWTVVAPALAFSVWGLSVPGLLAEGGQSALAAAAAIVVSPILKKVSQLLEDPV